MLRFLSSSMILASISVPMYGLQIANATHLDQRRGQEAAQADVEDQAALDDLDDGALTASSFSLSASMVPRARSYWALLGQDQASLPCLRWGLGLPPSSPTDTTSLGSTSCLMDSSAGRDDTFGLSRPMSSRTSSRSTLTIVPRRCRHR